MCADEEFVMTAGIDYGCTLPLRRTESCYISGCRSREGWIGVDEVDVKMDVNFTHERLGEKIRMWDRDTMECHDVQRKIRLWRDYNRASCD